MGWLILGAFFFLSNLAVGIWNLANGQDTWWISLIGMVFSLYIINAGVQNIRLARRIREANAAAAAESWERFIQLMNSKF